jgi:hypothetical protein
MVEYPIVYSQPPVIDGTAHFFCQSSSRNQKAAYREQVAVNRLFIVHFVPCDCMLPSIWLTTPYQKPRGVLIKGICFDLTLDILQCNTLLNPLKPLSLSRSIWKSCT